MIKLISERTDTNGILDIIEMRLTNNDITLEQLQEMFTSFVLAMGYSKHTKVEIYYEDNDNGWQTR